MPIVPMGRVFPRQILSPSQIFVNHSKLPVGFIGAFRRIHFTAHTSKHCMVIYIFDSLYYIERANSLHSTVFNTRWIL
jgi:hypothetical protein